MRMDLLGAILFVHLSGVLNTNICGQQLESPILATVSKHSDTWETAAMFGAGGAVCALYGLAGRELPIPMGVLYIIASPLAFNGTVKEDDFDPVVVFAGFIAVGAYNLADNSYEHRWRRFWIDTASIPGLVGLGYLAGGLEKRWKHSKKAEWSLVIGRGDLIGIQYRF